MTLSEIRIKNSLQLIFWLVSTLLFPTKARIELLFGVCTDIRLDGEECLKPIRVKRLEEFVRDVDPLEQLQFIRYP